MALNSNVKLQDHQSSALDHSEGKGGIIVNHGLGSGKTLTSMAIAEKRGGNVLVVVPAALRENYKEQLNKFVTPDRHKDYRIISYHEFMRDPNHYVDSHKPNTLVADEVHRLRNPKKMKGSFNDIRHKIPFMVGMTGSIVNNHPSEAVDLVNLVNGKKVMSKDEFERKHIGIRKVSPGIIGRLKGVQAGEVEEIKNRKALSKSLAPYIHRFEGSDEYRSNLPRTKEEEVKVDLSKKQIDMLKALEGSNPALAYKLKNNLPPSKQESQQLNSFMIGMRQVSNNPGTLDKTITDPIESSPKMRASVDAMQRKMKDDPNFRGVVYSRFLDGGVRPIADKLDGGVYEGSLSDKKRRALLDEFQSGKKKVMGISPSGGEGLDLKGVKLMQVLEPDWNPETTSQAIGRAVRYKSHAHLPEKEREVLIQRYIAQHPDSWKHKLPFMKKPTSPDEYLRNRSGEKSRLNRDFLNALGGK